MDKCFWCQIWITKKTTQTAVDKKTRDHVIPQAYGGQDINPNGSLNWVWSCRACNEERGAEMAEDWKKHGKRSQYCRNKWRLTTATRERERLLKPWGGSASIKKKRMAQLSAAQLSASSPCAAPEKVKA